MEFVYKGRREWFCQNTGVKKEAFDLEAFGTHYPFPVNAETEELANQLHGIPVGGTVQLKLELVAAAKPMPAPAPAKKAKSK